MDVMPADCGETWSNAHHHNHQPSQQTTEVVMECHWCEATDDCTGIRTGNDANFGSKTVPMTPPNVHNTMTGS